MRWFWKLKFFKFFSKLSHFINFSTLITWETHTHTFIFIIFSIPTNLTNHKFKKFASEDTSNKVCQSNLSMMYAVKSMQCTHTHTHHHCPHPITKLYILQNNKDKDSHTQIYIDTNLRRTTPPNWEIKWNTTTKKHNKKGGSKCLPKQLD